jgi:hypothetical protein
MNKVFGFLFLIFCSLISYSQNVGIGTNAPVASAALEVKDTTRGFLPPRMTYAQRNAIVNPAQGLIIYCTNCGINGEVQVFNSTEWVNIIGGLASNPVNLPSISTQSITNITINSAVSGGIISSNGNLPILSKGVCWSTSLNPTINLSTKTNDGSGLTSFTSNLTNLSSGTAYHLRAYATNALGTAYGADSLFTTSITPSIGNSYQGGVVAYIFQPGQPGYVDGEVHGIIASPNDLSTGIPAVGCAPLTYSIGSGLSNTQVIVNGCTSQYSAAKLCYEFVLNGYTDWFLPSRDELYILWVNRNNIGGFSVAPYWSSSGWYSNWTYWKMFDNGGYQDAANSENQYYVRAIRYF